MSAFLFQFVIYGSCALVIVIVFLFYIYKYRKESNEVHEKVEQAKEDGVHEPVSLYPFVDVNRCIKSGACIKACPEHDILGIRNGKATLINASHCIGHGACFNACPVEAISLWMGTEKRGVDIPQISVRFETNVPGIYVAGELGGMGLIRNAISQGKEAVENIDASLSKDSIAEYDLIVVGAGPAGISATLEAKKRNLKVLTLEQYTLGGTISNFPRAKVVMTSPIHLPLYGKVNFRETTKPELLNLWTHVLDLHKIQIKENCGVKSIHSEAGVFKVISLTGESFTSQKVLLAIGRNGSPRKLGVAGEELAKVAYRLLEPELILHKKILIVGGGDSAVESALMLAENNKVTLSYRSAVFTRLKKKNKEAIKAAELSGLITLMFETNVLSIENNQVILIKEGETENLIIENDLVYIFAGGVLPTQFLTKMGISVDTKHGEVVMKH